MSAVISVAVKSGLYSGSYPCVCKEPIGLEAWWNPELFGILVAKRKIYAWPGIPTLVLWLSDPLRWVTELTELPVLPRATYTSLPCIIRSLKRKCNVNRSI